MCIIPVRTAHLFAWRNPSGVDPGCWCSADECESGGFKWYLHSDAWHCFNTLISSQKKMVLYGSVVCYCWKLKHLDGFMYRTLKSNEQQHINLHEISFWLSSKSLLLPPQRLRPNQVCYLLSCFRLSSWVNDYTSSTQWWWLWFHSSLGYQSHVRVCKQMCHFTPPSLSLLSGGAWWSPSASMLGRTLKWHGWCSCSLSPAG